MKKFFYDDPKLLIYGFLIVFFASYGQTFFISIFNYEIRSYYNLSDGEFGLIYAIATILSAVVLISFAKLIDYIDLRIYSLLISIGMILSCLAMFFFIKHVFFLLLIIFSLRFFGQGAMGHAGETTMARYFGQNRGKALSVSTLGGMTGVMLLPMLIIYLMKFYTLNQIWLAASISLIIFIPIIFLLLNDQTKRHLNFKKNISSNSSNQKWRTRDLIKQKKFYIYLPLSITSSFVSTGLMFHQIFIFNQKGWSLIMMGNGFLFLGIFSIIGLLIGGPIIDKFNTRKTALTALLPLFLALLVLIFFNNYFSLLLYMSLYGLNH